jgi:flavin reductase (DIM6/NTAB) family NADH-FMN oxidoreductase RutF
VAFETIAARLEYPMFIVTAIAADDGERSGCLVGFTTQSSLKPARFLVCISHANHTHGVACRATTLAVHLAAAADRGLAELFGGQTDDRLDKFERCEWEPGPSGVPILARARDWFAGRVLKRFAVGDHDAFLLEPIEGEASGGNAPFLTSLQAASIEAGHPR